MFGAVKVKSDPNPPSCVPKESVDSNDRLQELHWMRQ